MASPRDAQTRHVTFPADERALSVVQLDGQRVLRPGEVLLEIGDVRPRVLSCPRARVPSCPRVPVKIESGSWKYAAWKYARFRIPSSGSTWFPLME